MFDLQSFFFTEKKTKVRSGANKKKIIQVINLFYFTRSLFFSSRGQVTSERSDLLFFFNYTTVKKKKIRLFKFQ